MTDKHSGSFFAINFISKLLVKSAYTADTLLSEIVVHASLTAQFHEALHDDYNFYIVSELCCNGTFQSRFPRIGESREKLDQEFYLRLRKLVFPTFRLSVVRQLFKAVQYLQSCDVVHDSIDESNICFVDGYKTLKLCGFSTRIAENFRELVGQFISKGSSSRSAAPRVHNPGLVSNHNGFDSSICRTILYKFLIDWENDEDDSLRTYRDYRDVALSKLNELRKDMQKGRTTCEQAFAVLHTVEEYMMAPHEGLSRMETVRSRKKYS